ncbi:unnamed protein product [Pleuronectes platessa]|uniref:Uncharacterized protein n=1 Tax=Pleuronectes platessa TaxID=8262 RepID=A0A9N7U3X9_PLEPL|nr:unnamed protein product [Pleuronectes platessa]
MLHALLVLSSICSRALKFQRHTQTAEVTALQNEELSCLSKVGDLSHHLAASPDPGLVLTGLTIMTLHTPQRERRLRGYRPIGASQAQIREEAPARIAHGCAQRRRSCDTSEAKTRLCGREDAVKQPPARSQLGL